MSTAVEEGIALPHARLPTLLKPVILFGRSLQGIEWNSPDGKPAHLIFLILTPKTDDEVQILRILSTVLSKRSDPGKTFVVSGQGSIMGYLKGAIDVPESREELKTSAIQKEGA